MRREIKSVLMSRGNAMKETIVAEEILLISDQSIKVSYLPSRQKQQSETSLSLSLALLLRRSLFIRASGNELPSNKDRYIKRSEQKT